MTDERNSTPMPPSDDQHDHAIDQATGDAERAVNARSMREIDDAERAAAALHRGLTAGGKLPDSLREGGDLPLRLGAAGLALGSSVASWVARCSSRASERSSSLSTAWRTSWSSTLRNLIA